MVGPRVEGTHLRFGPVSIRQLAAHAWRDGGEGAKAWLGELIWRDFYHQILWHHPHVVARAFPAGEPMAVRVGRTTFALRKREAALVRISTRRPVQGAAA